MVRCRLSMKIKYNKLQNNNYVTVNDREETVLEAKRRNRRHISIRKTDGLCSGVVQKLFSTLLSIVFFLSPVLPNKCYLRPLQPTSTDDVTWWQNACTMKYLLFLYL